MQRFLEELPVLIVTLVLIALIGTLLALGTITINNPLVGIIAAVIVPFWFLNAAFKWQAPGTVPPVAAPQPEPAVQKATQPPQFTTPVPQPPVQQFYLQPPGGSSMQPIPPQFAQYGATLPYPSVPGQHN